MSAVLRRIALRVALCAFVSWLVWRWLGTSGIVMTSPLFGVALARPLLDLASDLRHEFRRAHWESVSGQHYAFRDWPVGVVADADGQRWVRVADVRRILGFSASDTTLQVSYPTGFKRLGKPAEPHLSDEALLAHLGKDRSPLALKLRQWVEREIVFPARRERDRLGTRLESLDFRASD